MKSALGIAAVLGVLAAAPLAFGAPFHYRCKDGTRLSAEFVNDAAKGNSVNLAFRGKKSIVSLPQVMSADGGRYADDAMEFWINGNGARLTRAGKATSCTTTKP